ncbi:MAG: 50S ribosomal protein L11 methyltransferase [Acidimicrobiia bacterium]|nr:50S ribosomal protein L11 methyltransferase [Acidimicrobiia bacterium]
MRTSFSAEETGGLGPIVLEHPPGSFEPTAASRIGLLTVGRHQDLLGGVGVDWGCGVGVLAIATALVPSVEKVVGLDVAPANVEQAHTNAEINRVEDRTAFHVADSMSPVDAGGAAVLEGLTGRVDFVVANPPASVGDDGFGFRRRVMEDVAPFLVAGGIVLLNVSAQYGMARVLALQSGVFTYQGMLESTDAVPFDQARPDLAENLADYVAEEARGGVTYEFLSAAGETISATEARRRYQATGSSPLSRWQVHLFRKGEWPAVTA